MKGYIRIFPSQFELAEALALFIVNKITESLKANPSFTIALSGGHTPSILFSVMANHFGSFADWKKVHLFWVDERCVSPDNSQSNYRMAKRTFIDRIEIPDENIHRIMGESDPYDEAKRYTVILDSFTEKVNGIPSFNLTLLGLGEDGHVASIFPGNENYFYSQLFCLPAVHPVSGQKRITLSGKVINNSQIICFMVTGSLKAAIVKSIIEEESKTTILPASFVKPATGHLYWFLDNEAASLLAR